MRALLSKLLYDKAIGLAKSLSIYLVDVNIVLKEYFIYYLDIIPII